MNAPIGLREEAGLRRHQRGLRWSWVWTMVILLLGCKKEIEGPVDDAYRPPDGGPNPYVLVSARKVEQVIGDIDFESLLPTRQLTESRFGLAHTDLGASFMHKGKLWFLFGDSDPEAPGWDAFHDDAVAFTTADKVEDFMLTFLTNPNSGRGYLNPHIHCPDEGGRDCVDLGALNVPVAGISDGNSMFIWFTTGGAEYSLLARSDDDGRTYTKVYDFGNTHFIDMAAALYPDSIPGLPALSAGDQWVLIFGSGDHAHHHVYLAAAPLHSLQVGNRTAVRFMSGYKDNGVLSWSAKESDAVPLFLIEHGQGPGLMSELSHGWGFGEPLIHYNRTMNRWVATYNAARRTIRMRTAEHPWGPWSQSIVIFDPTVDYGRGPAYGRYIGDDRTPRLGGQGELYGPYVIEPFTRTDSNGNIQLYWMLSPWQPYVVLLMESTLRRR